MLNHLLHLYRQPAACALAAGACALVRLRPPCWVPIAASSTRCGRAAGPPTPHRRCPAKGALRLRCCCSGWQLCVNLNTAKTPALQQQASGRRFNVGAKRPRRRIWHHPHGTPRPSSPARQQQHGTAHAPQPGSLAMHNTTPFTNVLVVQHFLLFSTHFHNPFIAIIAPRSACPPK